MGMQIPGELASLLDTLGYHWPQSDEEKLYEMGNAWTAFGGRLPDPIGDADASAQRVWSGNEGDSIDAFRTSWTEAGAPRVNLEDGATAADLVGTGLFVCAGIVLALKMNVIVQLTLLAFQIAQAIATAPVTLGASLAEIPIFKMITGAIIDQLINLALEAVFNG